MKPSNLQLLRLLMVLVLLVPAVALLAQSDASPFYDYHAESPGTIHKVTVKDLPLPLQRNQRTVSRNRIRGLQMRFPKRCQGSKWSCTPPVWTSHANCVPRRTAMFFWP